MNPDTRSPRHREPPARLSAAALFARDVHCLLGLPVDAIDLETALRRVRLAAAERRPCFLSTPNLDFVIACHADPAFRDSLIDSDLSVADGMPLVWVARLLGIPIRERVAGSNLFEALRRGVGQRLGVYFFGGPPGAAALAGEQLNAHPDGLVCVGYDEAGYGSLDDMSRPERLQRINDSGADFLVVALGARRGQAWIERNRHRLAVPVLSHLGAVINHTAGTVRRAPAWMQQGGLEWLWRIGQEPALWRRYARDARHLAALLAWRVLPALWQAHRHPPPAEEIAGACVECESGDGRLVLRLHGAWVRGNLHRLRERLDDALLAGRDVRLDLLATTHVDTAALGLFMLLAKYQREQGRRLTLYPVQPAVARQFRLHCAEYLLAEYDAASETPISATVPDWRREYKRFWQWSPSRSLLASIRAYQRHRKSRHPWHVFMRRLAVLRHRFWSAVTGADIPVNSRIGGGLLLPHPNGVVIHPHARIGVNCLIFQQVTIGTGKKPGLAEIGGHVDIGVGARILGGVRIGDHARIGANAVVLCDVPAGHSAVGIPAIIVPPEPGDGTST